MTDKDASNAADGEGTNEGEGGGRLCELEKDVVIVVGDEEFQENSTILSYCSQYFDAAIRKERSKNKTNTTSTTSSATADPTVPLRFEFPNKNPKEWRIVSELIRPFPIVKITLNNMPLILPWFDQLKITRGMEECDRILCDQLGGSSLKALAPQKEDQSKLDQLKEYLGLILDGLGLCCKYNKTPYLRRSKMMLLGILGKVIQDHSILLGMKECKSLCHLLKTDEECYSELWEKLSVYLPQSFITQECATTTKKSKTLPITMNPTVFQKALYTGIQTHQSISELSWLERRALTWLQRPSPTKQQPRGDRRWKKNRNNKDMVPQEQEEEQEAPVEEKEENGNNNDEGTTTSSEQQQIQPEEETLQQ